MDGLSSKTQRAERELEWSVVYCTPHSARIRYVVADDLYSKYKWVIGVVQLGFHSIGRLRSDANLKFRDESPHLIKGRLI